MESRLRVVTRAAVGPIILMSFSFLLSLPPLFMVFPYGEEEEEEEEQPMNSNCLLLCSPFLLVSTLFSSLACSRQLTFRYRPLFLLSQPFSFFAPISSVLFFCRVFDILGANSFSLSLSKTISLFCSVLFHLHLDTASLPPNLENNPPSAGRAGANGIFPPPPPSIDLTPFLFPFLHTTHIFPSFFPARSAGEGLRGHESLRGRKRREGKF